MEQHWSPVRTWPINWFNKVPPAPPSHTVPRLSARNMPPHCQPATCHHIVSPQHVTTLSAHNMSPHCQPAICHHIVSPQHATTLSACNMSPHCATPHATSCHHERVPLCFIPPCQAHNVACGNKTVQLYVFKVVRVHMCAQYEPVHPYRTHCVVTLYCCLVLLGYLPGGSGREADSRRDCPPATLAWPHL